MIASDPDAEKRAYPTEWDLRSIAWGVQKFPQSGTNIGYPGSHEDVDPYVSCDRCCKALPDVRSVPAVCVDEDMDACIVTRILGKTGGLFEPGQTIMSLRA